MAGCLCAAGAIFTDRSCTNPGGVDSNSQTTYTATITPSPTSIAASVLSPVSTSTVPSASAAAGPGVLAVNDTYRLPLETFGTLLATSPGKIWLGTLHGTIVEYDRHTGAFGESISIPPSKMAVDKHILLFKIGFEGDHLWALGGGSSETGGAVALFAIDPGSGTIIQQWDLGSAE